MHPVYVHVNKHALNILQYAQIILEHFRSEISETKIDTYMYTVHVDGLVTIFYHL